MTRKYFQVACVLTFTALCYIGQVSCQTNVALNAEVTLSSMYTSGNPRIPDGDPYKATDGNNTHDWYVGGCASTKREKYPWMRVDLGAVYSLERMEIYNRFDNTDSLSPGCCLERLHDFQVSVKAAAEDVWVPVYQQTEAAGLVTDITFDSLYDARYMEIKITSSKPEYLTICELEVYEQGDPVNGGWTPWSDWTDCSATCGSGSQSRSRSCTNPAPKNGGSDCVGDSFEMIDCNLGECPVNGGWSDYGEWGDCSVTCGSGFRARTRTCTNPVPSGGGLDCDGSATQVDICVLDACSETESPPGTCTCTETCTYSQPPENCEDVRINLLMGGEPASSGQYDIRTSSGQTITVFCEFYDSRAVSYTYLSPAAIDVIDTSTLKTLHNKRLDYVNVRLLQIDGMQKDYEVGTLSAFHNKYPLDVQISEFDGYWQPLSYGTSSFLYLGLQPAVAAPPTTADLSTNPMFGFRANGKDQRFINCYELAKSYFALFTDAAAFQQSECYQWFNETFTYDLWELDLQVIPLDTYLPNSFFMAYELSMGGCAGFATSFKGLEFGIAGAQLGLPLDYRPKCLIQPAIQTTTGQTTEPTTQPTAV